MIYFVKPTADTAGETPVWDLPALHQSHQSPGRKEKNAGTEKKATKTAAHHGGE